MRTPSSALPALPQGALEGFGSPLPFFFAPLRLAAAFFVVIFTTFFAAVRFAAFFAAVFFIFLRISIFPCSLFLLHYALRIEISDAAALAAGPRVDGGVDERRLAGIHGRIHRSLQLVRRCCMDADASECFHHLVVTCALHEDGRGRVRTAGGIDVGPAIDAVVVEDDDADRQIVPADRLYLHAGTICRSASSSSTTTASIAGPTSI